MCRERMARLERQDCRPQSQDRPESRETRVSLVQPVRAALLALRGWLESLARSVLPGMPVHGEAGKASKDRKVTRVMKEPEEPKDHKDRLEPTGPPGPPGSAPYHHRCHRTERE